MKIASTFRRCVFVGIAATVSGIAFSQGVQSLDEVRATAEKYVREKIPKSALKIRVTAGQLDSRLRLAPCAQALQAALPAGGKIGARTTVAVSCKEAAGWTVYVPVTVVSQVSVLVLNRAATRGQRIAGADVEVQTREVEGPAESYLMDVAELAGRTLKRPLPAGTALTADVMVEDFLVVRGQQVTLLAAAGGIEVRATGRALNDGRAAGRVRAQNISSNEVVEGTVVSAGVIRVAP